MLHSPTLSINKHSSKPVFIEQSLYNSSLESNAKPIMKVAMSNDYEYRSKPAHSMFSKVNKTYEMYNGTLCESYFDISDDDETMDFMDDFASNNKLILVINHSSQIEELLNYSGRLKNSLKLIICSDKRFDCPVLPEVPKIYTNSIKHAVNEAYNRVENGESILFTNVNSHFDLFEHIDDF